MFLDFTVSEIQKHDEKAVFEKEKIGGSGLPLR